MNHRSLKETSALPGCGLSILIGILTVALVLLPTGILSDRSVLTDEWPFFCMWVVWIAAPFGMLSLLGVRDKLPSVVGLILTALFWGGLVVDAYYRASRLEGVDIGYALFMLILPAIIAGAALVVAKARNPSLKF